VIGHDDKRIQYKPRHVIAQIMPRELDDSAEFIQPHLPIHYLPQQTRPSLGAHRQKYAAG
jgi:hypothetical protein